MKKIFDIVTQSKVYPEKDLPSIPNHCPLTTVNGYVTYLQMDISR
jgi:hypothetical protein